MKKQLRNLKKLAQYVLILGIVSLLWLYPIPALAASNPDLEAQMIEVIRQHPDIILESIQSYQRQQQEQVRATQQTLAQNLLADPAGIIGLSPHTGDLENRAILLEFSDFQCPFCAKAQQTVKGFLDQHSDEVTLVYKHLPLPSIHPQALPAAQAAYAAQQQGKFWDYHDALFKNQAQLGEELYLKIAKKLKLDIDQFNGDRAQAMASIQQDMDLASRLKINGTPFFVFQGQIFSGAVPAEQFEELL